VSRFGGESSMCRWWGFAPPDQPLPADEFGSAGRAAAIVAVMAFTWLVEAGFKGLLKLF
jgi:hypothetical protein